MSTMEQPRKKRVDTSSRVITASPMAIYHAFIDPQALAAWLPPTGMQGQIETFEPREGGSYRMALTYQDPDLPSPGKTSDDTDVVSGRFLELLPGKRVVQSVEFDADDPAFSGTMTMTWSLDAVPGGTKVTIVAEDVPEGVRQEDHEVAFRSTLENLATYLER